MKLSSITLTPPIFCATILLMVTVGCTSGASVSGAPPATSGQSPSAKTGSASVPDVLRSVVGERDDAAILAAFRQISPGPSLVDGKAWFDMDPGYRVLDFDIGNNGSNAMMASPLGKLPVGILYVGRGDNGKGPACLKLTFLKDGSSKGVMALVSSITQTPTSKLQFGSFVKGQKAKVRMITGSKYVVYAVGWQEDPKASCAQIVIAARQENLAFVTIS